MNGWGNGLGAFLGGLYFGFLFLLFVAGPLAIWKLIDIIIWVWHHVHIGVSP